MAERESVRVPVDEIIAMGDASREARSAWSDVVVDLSGRTRSGSSFFRSFVSDATKRQASYRSLVDGFLESQVWPMVASHPAMRAVFGRAFRGEALRKDVVAEERWRNLANLMGSWSKVSPSPFRARAMEWVAGIMDSHADGIAARMRGREVWSKEGAAVALMRLDMAAYRAMREPGGMSEDSRALMLRAYELFQEEVTEDGIDPAEVVGERNRLIAYSMSSPSAPAMLRRVYGPAMVGMRPGWETVEDIDGGKVAFWDGTFVDSMGERISEDTINIRPPMKGPVDLARAIGCVEGRYSDEMMESFGDVEAAACVAFAVRDRRVADPETGVAVSLADNIAARDRDFAASRRNVSGLSQMALDDGLSRDDVEWARDVAVGAHVVSLLGERAFWGKDAARALDLVPAKDLVPDAVTAERASKVAVAFACAMADKEGPEEDEIVAAKTVAKVMVGRGWSAEDISAAFGVAAMSADGGAEGVPDMRFFSFVKGAGISSAKTVGEVERDFSRFVGRPLASDAESRDIYVDVSRDVLSVDCGYE